MSNNNNLSFREIAPFFEDAIRLLSNGSSEIKKTDNDHYCKCPVCGDSRTKNKKRLHLYQKGDVININCFNGDCQVKNYTPYRFFKEFTPRIFDEYRLFYRRRFFNEISNSSKKNKPTENLKFNDLTVEELFGVPEPKYTQQILDLIEEFQFTGDDKNDLVLFKQLAQKIKQLGDTAIAEFKAIIQ